MQRAHYGVARSAPACRPKRARVRRARRRLLLAKAAAELRLASECGGYSDSSIPAATTPVPSDPQSAPFIAKERHAKRGRRCSMSRRLLRNSGVCPRRLRPFGYGPELLGVRPRSGVVVAAELARVAAARAFGVVRYRRRRAA